jgi:glycosyltransferase involved in cell wall biosynthesis
LRIALLSESKVCGGAEQYLLLLARGIVSLGHEAVFFLPAQSVWRGRVDAGGWDSYEYPDPSSAGLLRRVGCLLSALRSAEPDILHINLPSTYSASLSAGALAARVRGCSVVTTEHLSMIGRARRMAPFKALFTSFVQKIIAVSDATRGGLVDTHGIRGDKIVVVLNGVDLEELDAVSRDEARTRFGIRPGVTAIGCVGELIKRKGQSFLIDAIAEVYREFEGTLQLVLVGDGEERGALESQAKRRGLGEAVTFSGHIDGAGPLLKAFDIFVMPSLMEALPFALLEAMAGGVPPVATSVYGIPEVVRDGETGLLVPPADTPALTAAIRRLLTEPDLRERFAAASRELAEKKFSLENMVSQTVAVYESVRP